MSGEKCRQEYIRRIHKAQDYMEQHLKEKLSVQKIADAAGFSKYHFSRIFEGFLKESLAHYINRLRMEKACFLLAHREDKNMTDIAYELGFADSAIFSRGFKHYYGMSPRTYRVKYRTNCKESFVLSSYNKRTDTKEGSIYVLPVKGQVEIRHMEEKRAVYIRHTGTYESLSNVYDNMVKRLLEHVKKQHVTWNDESRLLAAYHDNPEFGDDRQFRTSLCLTVPAGTTVREEGTLGMMILEGGLYAVGYFEIQKNQYSGAWNYMYEKWLMGSGYVPRNTYPFEVYCNNPQDDENHISKVEIYVPVEPVTL